MHIKPHWWPATVFVLAVAAYLTGIWMYGGLTQPVIRFVGLGAIIVAMAFSGILTIKNARTEQRGRAETGKLTAGVVLAMLAGFALIMSWGFYQVAPSFMAPITDGIRGGAPVFVIGAIALLLLLVQKKPIRTKKPRKAKKTGFNDTNIDNVMNGD